MINLAFIGAKADAVRYGAIANRIHGARWSMYGSLGSPDSMAEAKVLGSAVETASLSDMVNGSSDDVDAFVIHAPLENLPELVKSAGESAKPLLVGPLVAKDVDDLNRLVDLAGDSRLFAAHSWRFNPAIQSVKASISAGNLGDIGLIRIHRWNSRATEDSHSLVNRIIPDIDIATWFFGSQPQKIFAMQSNDSSSYLQSHLSFKNGGMAVLDEAGALPKGGDYYSLTVIGGNGAAYADDHRNMNLIVDGLYPHAIRTEQGLVHLVRQLQAFVDAIRNGSPYPIDRQNVATTLQVADSVLQAAATKRVLVLEGGHYV